MILCFVLFFTSLRLNLKLHSATKKKGCIWWQFPSSRDSQAGSSVSVLTVNSAVPFWNKWPLVKSQRCVGGGGWGGSKTDFAQSLRDIVELAK